MAVQHKILSRLILAGFLLPLAACAGDPKVGYVVQHNVVAQVVDLEPQYAGTPIEGGSGQRSVEAVRRYNTGKLTPLEKSGGTAGGPQ